jgi:hypothetical protein
VSTPRAAVEWAGLGALGAGIVWLLTVNLDTMPGLHGDEAWVGLRAHEIATGASSSVHGVNFYTGVLMPYLATLSFRAFGTSVLSLRAIGVAANLAAIALLAATAWVVTRKRSGVLGILLLVASSLLVVCESRVAWEVTALNPFVAALSLLASVLWLSASAPWSRTRLAVACALVVFAPILVVYSHFIYAELAAALLVASLLTALRYSTEPAVQYFVAQLVATANIAPFAVLKLALYRTTAAPSVALASFAVLLAIEVLALSALLARPAFVSRVRDALGRRATLLRAGAITLLAIGVAAFAGFHLVAFVQMLANDAVAKRLFSTSFSAPLLAASYAYAALLVALYFYALYRVRRGLVTPRAPEYFLLVLPIAVAAALPAVVTSNSLRYYNLPNLALLVGACVALALLPRVAMHRALAGVAVYAAILATAIVPVVADAHHYESVRPIYFHFGYRRETSAHFLPTDVVYRNIRDDGMRIFVAEDTWFLHLPLSFYSLCLPAKAGADGVATVRYDYERSGGVAYSVSRLTQTIHE